MDRQPESFVEPYHSFSLESNPFQNLPSRFRVWSHDVNIACLELAGSIRFYSLATNDVYRLRFLLFQPLSQVSDEKHFSHQLVRLFSEPWNYRLHISKTSVAGDSFSKRFPRAHRIRYSLSPIFSNLSLKPMAASFDKAESSPLALERRGPLRVLAVGAKFPRLSREISSRVSGI